MKESKVLSIMQPHAALLLTPHKGRETRSWHTNYRGEILLHASARMPSRKANAAMYAAVMPLYERYEAETGKALPMVKGCIYARAVLSDCIEMTAENIARLDPLEIAAGYYTPGRYMWILDHVEPLQDPVFCPGKLGIWTYEGRI